MNAIAEQDILSRNTMMCIHSCAELLLEKEKISREEFESLFTGEVSEA